MIDLIEILSFRDPEVLAIAIGILIFIVCVFILSKRLDKGVAIVIAFCVSLITVYALFTNRFFGFERALAFILYLAVFAVFFKIIIRPFWRFLRNQF